MTPAILREARRELGLTQAGLAAFLSEPGSPINPRTIRRWESGESPIPGLVKRAIREELRRKAWTQTTC